MTRTMKILRAMLKDGDPRTAAKLSVEFELTPKQAKEQIEFMRRRKYIQSVAGGYGLDAAGIQHGTPRGEAVEARLLRHAALMARLRAKAPKEARRQPTRPNLTIVQATMAKRPALDMAWMSVAREQEAANV